MISLSPMIDTAISVKFAHSVEQFIKWQNWHFPTDRSLERSQLNNEVRCSTHHLRFGLPSESSQIMKVKWHYITLYEYMTSSCFFLVLMNANRKVFSITIIKKEFINIPVDLRIRISLIIILCCPHTLCPMNMTLTRINYTLETTSSPTVLIAIGHYCKLEHYKHDDTGGSDAADRRKVEDVGAV